MKSLIVSLALIGFYNTTQAQNSPSQNMAENKSAKVTETTINGIPYSQYKAQQEALKQANLQAQQKQIQQLNLPSVITTDDIQKPAAKPAEVKPNAPAVKSVSAQYADKTIPGTLVPMPAATVATSTEAVVPVQTTVQPKMPELKQQAQKVEVVEVPASVTQPAIKAPVVPMQTEKGKGG